MRAIEEAGTEFVLGGFFPPLTRTNAVAAELYAQFLGRPDVLYYDWEITQERLKQWREMYLLRSFFLMSSYSPTNAPSQKWLIALEPELGNTITEATLTSPNEVLVTRKSHLGFTGWELVTLMRWLDSTHFPMTFDPAPPFDREAARREHRKQAGAANATTGRPKLPLSTNAPGTKVRSLPGGAVPVPVPATEKKPPGTPAPPATPKQP